MIEPDVEHELRDVFRSRAAVIPAPIEPYQELRRRERRRQHRAVLGSALAVVLVIAGAIGAGLALRPDGVRSTAPALTVVGDTRGSLAGDRALLLEAGRVALATKLTGRDAVDPQSLRVPYAEQVDGYTVVLVVGRGLHEDYAAVFLGRAPGERALTVAGGTSFYSGQTTAAGRADGRGFLDPVQVLSVVTIGDRGFGVAIFPAGSRATVSRTTTLQANCTVAAGQAVPLPLTDGAAMFPVAPGGNPQVRVTDGRGRPLLARPAGAVGGGPADLTEEQAAAQVVASMRGDAPADQVAGVAGFARVDSEQVPVAERPIRYVGIWAGRLPGRPGIAALMGAQYASGAIALNGLISAENGQGYTGWSVNECLPAGQPNTLLLGQRLFGDPTQPVIMIGPPGAASARVSFSTGAPVPVRLTGGGGLLAHPGTLVRVSFFDRDGQQLGSALPSPGPFVELPH